MSTKTHSTTRDQGQACVSIPTRAILDLLDRFYHAKALAWGAMRLGTLECSHDDARAAVDHVSVDVNDALEGVFSELSAHLDAARRVEP